MTQSPSTLYATIRTARRSTALVTALLVAVPVAWAGATLNSAPWNSAEIAWKDMRSGVKEASATGKTAMMVLHAEWCSACKKYREVFKDPKIVTMSADYVMILVDVDKDPTTNGAFSPDGTYVPRTLFITADGDVRSDLVGKSDPEHPHTIDNKGPDELLSLMKKGARSSKDIQEQTMLLPRPRQ
jgi:protein-disulfide reductase (glutathione)